jgi:DNA processing protein
MKNEATYWTALAHLPNWGYGKINSLIVRFFHEEKISIEDFFNLPHSAWSDKFQLDQKDISDLQKAKSELPGNAFFVDNLINQGYELIPITSSDYSKVLKQNLKASHSPALLYVKGNKKILNERAIAIVGSRSAKNISLEFTDNIARLASLSTKVVVSGFAKGVDKQALDSAIKYKGKSIIVLPQGITTFSSGFKAYYRQIVGGDVLVLSTFPPKAVWSVGLAMARNPIIYGLAEEIYVAESSEKGGTWAGVIDGLRKKRRIFVRQADSNEKNANSLLIQKGAIPVGLDGKEIEVIPYNIDTFEQPVLVKESEEKYQLEDSLEKKILSVFNGTALTAKEILCKLDMELNTQKLTGILKKLSQIEIIKTKKPYKFQLKDKFDQPQKSLFD